MIVRVATHSDIPEFVRLKGHLLRTYLSADLDAHPDWPERAAAALAALLPRDTHLFLVAEEGGRTLGCVSARLDLGIPGPTWPGVHASVADMFVEPDARGRGIARSLMAAALEWCREHGSRNVHLHSTPMARPVYEALGFHVGIPQPGDELFPVMWLDF